MRIPTWAQPVVRPSGRALLRCANCHGSGRGGAQAQREKREAEEFAAFRKENPLIKEQFGDLKRELAAVSEAEWKAIPEIGDYTVKRRKRFENFSAASDSLLAGACPVSSRGPLSLPLPPATGWACTCSTAPAPRVST